MRVEYDHAAAHRPYQGMRVLVDYFKPPSAIAAILEVMGAQMEGRPQESFGRWARRGFGAKNGAGRNAC